MELISLHVPKTAGTAFTTLLKAVYPAKALLLDYEDRIGHPDSRFRTDFAGWQRDNELRLRKMPGETRAVHGHFWAGKYLPHFPEARKILWLRQPARLLISAYFYWKAMPASAHPLHQLVHEKNLSLLEFAALPEVQNPVTGRFLNGYGIADFDFIGIQEHFLEDVRDICQWMDWPKEEVPIVNKTVSDDYAQFDFDEATLDQIQAFNSDDVTLYEAALEGRRERGARALQQNL